VAKRKDKYYIQVSGWGTKGESQFQEVDGTPVQIKGAEGADLFLHRPPAGGGWKISSGINGMYVAWGDTEKQAIEDASQKGKPDAIMRLLKEYMASGKPLSPRFKLSGKSKPESTSLPAGLSVKKTKNGWEVIHTASGNRLMPFAYPEKQLATDFAVRAGQVADWTRPFKDLQAESEKLADLIRGGKKPGMFEKVLDMPTTFPKAVDDIQGVDKGQLIREILKFSPGSKEYPDQAKSLSVLHTYELRAVLRDLRESDVARLQAIHDARSPRSKSADESRSNALTIDTDDPRVERWIKDQGRSDIVGIDTPRKAKSRKPARKMKRAGKMPTQVRGLR